MGATTRKTLPLSSSRGQSAWGGEEKEDPMGSSSPSKAISSHGHQLNSLWLSWAVSYSFHCVPNRAVSWTSCLSRSQPLNSRWVQCSMERDQRGKKLLKALLALSAIKKSSSKYSWLKCIYRYYIYVYISVLIWKYKSFP